MKIAYIAAGAAGMYCGSCIHDNTLAAALLARGHDVALIPTYTPIRTDERGVSGDRVFYGAVNVYLQQKFALFRKTPAFLDWLLDRPRLLAWVARLGSSTDARELGDLTLSVLRGEDGQQRKELGKLMTWLEEFQPDVVQLTNSMFLGMARSVRQRLGCPVLCGLTGEDLFLDDLLEPARSQVLAELERRAQDADGFLATSRYYADHMRGYLGVESDKVHVVRLGIDLGQLRRRPRERQKGDPVTIGYLARICPEKGLDLLAAAFQKLAGELPKGSVRLRVAGYLAQKDAAFLRDIEQRLDAAGLSGSVEVLGEVDRERKLAFLESLDLLSVPTAYREPKGLYVLEALAHGVPVVQPAHGAFPELIEATGGGLLFEPGSAEELAAALRRLVEDEPLRRQLGDHGRQAVDERYHHDAMAARTEEVYRSVLGRRAA